jgi:branched-chain amino acid transport system substrate-binding protein
MKRITAILVVVLALGLMLSGCAKTPESTTITVGLAGPMTGDSAELGQEMANAANMAVDEFNATDVLGGKTIVLDIQDDRQDPNQAAIIAQKFVDGKVTAVLGHWGSGCTAAAMPIYQASGTPCVAPTPSKADLITLPRDSYIFRTADSQEVEGAVLADLFVNKLGKKKIAILYAASDWGNSNHASVKKNLDMLNATVVYDKSYTEGAVDFQAPLTAIAAAKPDLIYFGAYYNDLALLCRQAREMGIKQPISGSGVDYAEALIELGGTAVEGVYVNTMFSADSPDPRDQAFIKSYQTRYGKMPTTNVMETYESAKVLFEAIRIGGTDRAAIRDALENMTNFVAFNRPVTFSKTNHNSFNTHYIVVQVKDGKFVPVTF